VIGPPDNVNTEIYYMRYIALVKGLDLVPTLKANLEETLSLVAKLKSQDLDFSYAEGKWNIGVLLQHLCDAERVYAYRALRFLRGDKSNLPGFDEDAFAAESKGYIQVNDFVTEFTTIRNASIALFENSNIENIDFLGRANSLEMTPRIIAWLMVGHVMHHVQILEERYLVK
jgi:uncharacterized damage-inducible protein DinB